MLIFPNGAEVLSDRDYLTKSHLDKAIVYFTPERSFDRSGSNCAYFHVFQDRALMSETPAAACVPGRRISLRACESYFLRHRRSDWWTASDDDDVFGGGARSEAASPKGSLCQLNVELLRKKFLWPLVHEVVTTNSSAL